ncbi:leucine-rich repeat protein [Ruminococcus sp.]|uniref:leucine-rich repeat protein n=1 Tax=Ruminococcus sp. TaxID=41978 RepID=UPI00300F76ED
MFNSCSSLSSIFFPKSLSSIGMYAFHKTAWFNAQSEIAGNLIIVNNILIGSGELSGEVTLPEGLVTVAPGALRNQRLVTGLHIPEGVTAIGAYAFQDTSISAIQLPATLEEIGDYAFYGTELEDIQIPDRVTAIGDMAFDSTPLIQKQNSESMVYAGNWLISCDSSVTSVTIRPDTVGISSNAFAYNKNLTEVQIPEGVRVIGMMAFSGCEKLQTVTLPESLESIGTEAFRNCYALEKIYIPDNVTTLGAEAFQRCQTLTEAHLPNGITKVPSNLFTGCQKLESIAIPANVTEIGDAAFSACYALTSATLPDGLERIGSSAFSSCRALTAMELPASVKEIAVRAFEDCWVLQKITICNPNCDIYGSIETISNGIKSKEYSGHFDGIIYGYRDSSAQSHAEAFGITFVALDGVDFDINGDGECNFADYVLLQKYLIRQENLSKGQLPSADISQDAAINGMDLALLRQWLFK